MQGSFPELFHQAVAPKLETRNNSSAQPSEIKYVFFGADNSFLIQFHDLSTVWSGIPENLVARVREYGNEGLYLSKNTVLCPWDRSYYFVEWETVGWSYQGDRKRYAWNIHPNGCLSDILVREIIEEMVPVSYNAQASIEKPPPSELPVMKSAKAGPTCDSGKPETQLKLQDEVKQKNPFRKQAETSRKMENVDREQQEVFKKIFYETCEAGSNHITGTKAVLLLSHYGKGLGDEVLANIWEQSDDDNNGMLDLAEFLKAMELIELALAKAPFSDHSSSLLDRISSPPPPYSPHQQGNAITTIKTSMTAIAKFDYNRSEDNEIDLVEGQPITEIEQVDNDWWMGRNGKGEIGLFPSNYVKLVDESGNNLTIQAQPNPLPLVPTIPSVSHTSVPKAHRQPNSTRKTDTDLICSLCCGNISDYAYSCSVCENGAFDMCQPCDKLGRSCPGRHTLQCVKIEIEYGIEEAMRKINLKDRSNPSRNDFGGGTNSRKEEDKHMKEALMAAIITEKPNVKWEDIAGLNGAKEELQEAIVLPLRFPDLFTEHRKSRKGILLYGPPGTGKSYLAKAIATEVDSTLFSISASDLLSKWIGESERLIKQLFQLARERKPSIIFIDEIDSLCASRDGNSNPHLAGTKTEILVQMDGVGKNNEGLLILAATNMPWSLDPAIRRRFQRRIHIPLPDEQARRQLFKISAGKMKIELSKTDYLQLGKASAGLSGSDIANAIQDALMVPIKKIQTATHYKKVTVDGKQFFTPCTPEDAGAITMSWKNVPKNQLREPKCEAEDVHTALSKVKPSVSQEDIDNAKEWTDMYGSEGA
jgi:vacuolar protein-sorting-associated protein 4